MRLPNSVAGVGIFEQPHLAGVIADPRVQAEMARWEQEEAGLREELRAFLSAYYSSDTRNL